MTAMLIRIVIFLLIAGAIYLGVRRIWRDWKGEFKAVDKQKRERDQQGKSAFEERGHSGNGLSAGAGVWILPSALIPAEPIHHVHDPHLVSR